MIMPSSLYEFDDFSLRQEVLGNTRAAKKSRMILEERLGIDTEIFIKTGVKPVKDVVLNMHPLGRAYNILTM